MAKITVDGRTIECKDRRMIIQACEGAGIDIPRYCYHPGLSIVASCRICLVEVEGIPKLVPACQTPIRDGMIVHTRTSKVAANQKQVMEYLLVNHPLDCPVCDQAGECLLQDYSYQYGRAQSRFEEDKHKKPKKDIGQHVLLYNDRCIMCTRCVRFTREVSGASELYVDGRGHKEEIEIFPGKPLDNKLSGCVVDLCPVGALLDKDFLFKQRVWMLKQTPSISPVDAGGENIYLEHNEGVIHRIKPRYNAEVNTWWISDDTRYAYKVVHDPKRLRGARKNQYGSQVDVTFETAIETANTALRDLAKEGGAGSLYALLSPMMACEEAWLLGRYIRSIDPQAALVLGPVPTTGTDEVFKHYLSGKETFRIKAEKVPNAAGIKRVIALLGGPTATWEELVAGKADSVKKLKGGWIVGGYHSAWLGKDQPGLFRKGLRIVQDIVPHTLTDAADVLLPGASWAEKDGCWENWQGKIQPFAAAIPVLEGARREGEIYAGLLGRAGGYDVGATRAEMGEPFAGVKIADQEVATPAFEFVEL